MKTRKPFGTWSSPITPATLGQSLRLDDVQWDSDGKTLVWSEGRSGRKILVAQTGLEARRELINEQRLSGGVGYGGGEFSIGSGTAIFADESKRLFSQTLGATQPRAITPAYGGVASPSISPDGRWIVYVFSDGETDLLGVVDSAGEQWPAQLVKGADFYMQPTWHPSGELLAWVEWNHPNMPWDDSIVRLAKMTGDPPRVSEVRTVGGAPDRAVSQPTFSPDGRWLAFVEAGDEWDNLILYDLQSQSRHVLHAGSSEQFALPAWGQGQRSIGWSHDSHALYAISNYAGYCHLLRFSLDGSIETIPTQPYTWFTQLSVSPIDGRLAMIASAPTVPARVLLWDGAKWQVVARSETETTDSAYLSIPQPITWQSTDGEAVHGFYFPVSNPQYEGYGSPPVMLNVHGGPTSQAPVVYTAGNSYFTSRGYAVIEVNYRGSTGYGKSYRDALRHRWGDVDVEDTVSCARSVGQLGLGDEKRRIIKGGSAGGYTVLNSLVRYPGVFKAAVCLYGVSNLFTLDMDTHKFEQHYNHSLVGDLPEAAERYHAWSPVFHAGKITDPMIVFQGAEDRVVPPNQSDEIVAVLRRNGVPHKYIQYEGEGHGFRKAENIANFYMETERFLTQHVLFAP